MAKTILVIDDSASLRQLVRMSLQAAGYDVVEADDGSTALTKLDGRKLHLAVCDVNMPRLDGISFVKQARAKADYRFLPVIMLTTESQESKKLEGKAAGAKAWITKPFQPSQLLDAVAKLCLP
jgi:two-component system, chemotaxis family, chemotaxis protein CheY